MYHKLKDIKDELAFLEFRITVKWYIIAEKKWSYSYEIFTIKIN